jgi:hypothetical protein
VVAASIHFALTDAGGNAVPLSAVSYNTATHTATVTPAATLAPFTAYTATVSGVTDLNGNPQTSPVTWSFTTAASALASFVGTDFNTEGSWGGVVGTDGYLLPGVSSALPAYAQVTPSGQLGWTWSASTTDRRAPQTSPQATARSAACWYSPSQFSVDLNLIDGKNHQVALYLLDWDSTSRGEKIQVVDLNTGKILDLRPVNGFHNGQWLVWNLTGHVRITFTRLQGANAVLNGLMFDPPAAPIVPQPVPTSVAFQSSDTTTQGTWSGAYGADGYDLFGGNQSILGYAAVAAAGETAWTWAASTTDLRALQQSPGSTSRLAAAWDAPSSFTLDVNLTDGNAHRVALYLVDWDSTFRSETVTMTDAATGSVLDSRAVSAFHNGEYLVWTATGHFKITIARTGGANAVASALLFG